MKTSFKKYLVQGGYQLGFLGACLFGAITNNRYGFVLGGLLTPVIIYFFWGQHWNYEQKRPPSLDDILESNEDRIESASSKKIIYAVGEAAGQDIPPVPAGKYYETAKVFYEEIEQLRNRNADNDTGVVVWGWFIVILLGVIAAMGSKWYYEDTWRASWDSPFIYRSHPGLFSERKTYYAWGKDSQGEAGWIMVDGNGKPLDEPSAIATDEFFPQ